MGELSRNLELTGNVIREYDHWFNNEHIVSNMYMLNCFMNEHAYIFNAVSTKLPRLNTDGVGHAELSEYVRNAVAVITKAYSRLVAFEAMVSYYAKIRIVPYMVNMDSDEQFWMALDGYFP